MQTIKPTVENGRAKRVRCGDSLFVVLGEVAGLLHLLDVDTQQVVSKALDDPYVVEYQDVTSERFHEAVAAVLKPEALTGLHASGMAVPEVCRFVAVHAFLNGLAEGAQESDIVVIRQTLWHSSQYDGTNGFVS